MKYSVSGALIEVLASEVVRSGDPNGKSLPKWDAYNMKTNDGKAMVLGDMFEFGPQIDVPVRRSLKITGGRRAGNTYAGGEPF